MLFVYLFMLKEAALPEQFRKLSFELTNYLDKRIEESAHFDKEERNTFVEKINVNKRLVERHFDGNCSELDIDWIRQLCSGLLTGRQKNTISKPLKTL